MAGEFAISTNEMKELVSWLESLGCNIGATQQGAEPTCLSCGRKLRNHPTSTCPV